MTIRQPDPGTPVIYKPNHGGMIYAKSTEGYFAAVVNGIPYTDPKTREATAWMTGCKPDAKFLADLTVFTNQGPVVVLGVEYSEDLAWDCWSYPEESYPFDDADTRSAVQLFDEMTPDELAAFVVQAKLRKGMAVDDPIYRLKIELDRIKKSGGIKALPEYLRGFTRAIQFLEARELGSDVG